MYKNVYVNVVTFCNRTYLLVQNWKKMITFFWIAWIMVLWIRKHLKSLSGDQSWAVSGWDFSFVRTVPLKVGRGSSGLSSFLYLSSVLGSSFMQGSELPQVHGIHIGSVLHTHTHKWHYSPSSMSTDTLQLKYTSFYLLSALNSSSWTLKPLTGNILELYSRRSDKSTFTSSSVTS